MESKRKLASKFRREFLGVGEADSLLDRAQASAIEYKREILARHRDHEKHTQSGVIRKTSVAIRSIINDIVQPYIRLPVFIDRSGVTYKSDTLKVRRERIKKESKIREQYMSELMKVLQRPEIDISYTRYKNGLSEYLTQVKELKHQEEPITIEEYISKLRTLFSELLYKSDVDFDWKVLHIIKNLYIGREGSESEQLQTFQKIEKVVHEIVRPLPTLRGELDIKDEDAFDMRAQLISGRLLDNFEELNQKDRLTFLMKRGPFIDRLVELVRSAEQDGKQLIMFNIDADFFKAYNSAFSHEGGDAALSAISLAILETIEPLKHEFNITVGRIGGEELTGMMLVESSMDMEIVSKLMTSVHEAIEHSLAQMFTTQSKVFGDGIKAKTHFVESIMESRSKELSGALRSKRDGVEFLKKYIESHADCPFTVDTFTFKDHFRLLDEVTRRSIIGILPLGTVTSGVLRVDFGNPSQNYVSADDLRHVYERVNGRANLIPLEEFREVFRDYVGAEKESTIKFAKHISYREYWTLINLKIIDLQKKLADETSYFRKHALRETASVRVLHKRLTAWKELMDIVEERRVGRLLDKVDAAQEEGKKEKRAVMHGNPKEVTNIQTIDKQSETSTQEIKDIVAFDLKKENQELVDELAELSEKEEIEAFEYDPRLKRVSRMETVVEKWYERFAKKWFQKVIPEVHVGRGKRLISKIQGAINRAVVRSQKTRYREALTFSLNDDFLYGVCSRLLSKYYADRRKWTGEREDVHFSVVSYDFDNLKAINESGGHFLGDVVLRTCARNAKKILKDHARGSMLVRVGGGEEFVIVAPDYSSEHMKDVMKLINDTNRESVQNLLSKIVVDDEKVRTLFEKWKIILGNESVSSVVGRLSGRNIQANGVTMYDLSRCYIASHNEIQGNALSNIGTVTSGIVDIAEIPEDVEDLRIEQMRQIGDTIGENKKKSGQKGDAFTLAQTMSELGFGT